MTCNKPNKVYQLTIAHNLEAAWGLPDCGSCLGGLQVWEDYFSTDAWKKHCTNSTDYIFSSSKLTMQTSMEELSSQHKMKMMQKMKV